MQCTRCGQTAVIFHVTEVFGRGQCGEAYFCEKCGTAWGQVEGAQPLAEIANRGPLSRLDGATRFVIARVCISAVHDQQVAMLQEAGGLRLFSLVIGVFEATMLHYAVKGMTFPRPLTHHGWIGTIRALGWELQDVFLDDVRDFTYYARLRIRQRLPDQAGAEAILSTTGRRPPAPGRLVEVDVRPSDAFVLAVQLDAPIFVRDALLEQVTRPPETGFREGPPRPHG
jgi:bifunctional DNase/RNase